MCSVSAVTGYGMRMPDDFWNQQTWPPFKDLVREAEIFDKITKQPDCIDPEKDEWMKRIEERLEKLEAAERRERAGIDALRRLPVAVGSRESLRWDQPEWEIG